MKGEAVAGNWGYAGKILRVDLTSGGITEIPTQDYAEGFLGGRGFAAKAYWDEVPPEADAFDPGNHLSFMTGPLCGVPGLAGSRWTICGKSPSTAPQYFSNCNLGGSWGAHLKFAGFDGVVVGGKSERPVYIFISDGAARLEDASHLWGRSAVETREGIKSERGSRVRVAAIGPAGENLVNFAIVLADEDSSGSSGFGAVMGSKNLKAVAVSGNGKVAVAREDEVRRLAGYARGQAGETPIMLRGMTPGPKMKRVTCYGCIRGCTRATAETRDGVRSKYVCESAQFYQALAKRYYGEWGFDNIEVPVYANRFCDGYGIDTNCITSMLVWLARCQGAGILGDENTGLPLSKLGSLEFIEALVRKISLREGFGDILARGIFSAAEEVGGGAREMASGYVSKSGPMITYDPRMFPAHSLLYAMESRNRCTNG
ncbi:aldehyde ferredoxin oxidoreductase N-terminal domain-containing protein [Chloroflexota bacterium]